MSSSQVFPSLTGTIAPGEMGPDTTSAMSSTDWYTSNAYTFTPDSYITPYPSSTVESQPWQYHRPTLPNIHLNAFEVHPQQGQQQSPPATTHDPSRPKSSPSTFGPSADAIEWSNPLGIHYPAAGGHPTPPVTSTFPPNVFTNNPPEEAYRTSSPPELRQPQPQRPYTKIAPHPSSVGKRPLDDDDHSDPSNSGRKRRRTGSMAGADLNEEDRFLVQLKEEESLPWKDIATRFQADKGKPFQVAALQMRYKRLREKFRIWEEQDLQALKLAYEYWEKYKWEIISAKMLDFGIQERWPARLCAKRWQELEAATVTATATATSAAGLTPATMAQYSSPSESVPVTTAASQYAFIPNNYHHHHQ